MISICRFQLLLFLLAHGMTDPACQGTMPGERLLMTAQPERIPGVSIPPSTGRTMVSR